MSKKKSKIQLLTNIIHQVQKKPMFFLLRVLVSVALVVAIMFWIQLFRPVKNSQTISGLPTVEEIRKSTVDCQWRRKLDGVCVGGEDQVNPVLVGVMIDNHPEARPQSGLSQASIVYEVPVEGRYTRYFALYPAGMQVDQVGPVRSARPYFLDLAGEYGAGLLYFHVGGSPEALASLDNYDFFDINEFFQSWYFWREKTKFAPHNTYTASQFWESAVEKKQLTSSEFEPWSFLSSDETSTGEDVQNINLNFQSDWFDVDWQYNSSTAKYERSISGRKQFDGGDLIVADTVVVMETTSRVLDDVGRLAINLKSGGKSNIFVQGKKIVGEWQKNSNGRTIFIDEKGSPIKLARGRIWIEIVDQNVATTLSPTPFP